jgi:hypothetical protein
METGTTGLAPEEKPWWTSTLLIQNVVTTLMAAAWKVAGAFVIWLVGRGLIVFATRTRGPTLIGESFTEAGFPAPTTAYTVSGVWSGPVDQVPH